MVEKFLSVVCRLFFLGAFVLFGLGVIERIAYAADYKLVLVGSLTGGRLMEIAIGLLVFVIAIQLREIRKKP